MMLQNQTVVAKKLLVEDLVQGSMNVTEERSVFYIRDIIMRLSLEALCLKSALHDNFKCYCPNRNRLKLCINCVLNIIKIVMKYFKIF